MYRLIRVSCWVTANDMEPIANLLPRTLPKPAADDRRTERGEWLQKFCDRLNPERLKAPPQFKLKPLTIPRMARLLEQVPTGDLYAFWRDCERAKHFSKYFWWSLDAKKHKEL